MSRKIAPTLSAVMYFLAFFAFVLLIGTDVVWSRSSHIEKFITALAVFVCGYGGTALRCCRSRVEKYRYRTAKRTFLLLFFVYVVIVVDFTLIDDSFGRDISNIFTHNREQIRLYIAQNTNLVPFATISLFIRGYLRGQVTLGAVLENIVGNIIVLMPFAFFLPVVFQRINGWIRFLTAVTLTVLVIELLQFLFLTGSSDIDDLILNVSGAAAAYGLLHNPSVKRFVSHLTFGVWCADEKK